MKMATPSPGYTMSRISHGQTRHLQEILSAPSRFGKLAATGHGAAMVLDFMGTRSIATDGGQEFIPDMCVGLVIGCIALSSDREAS